jgi:hypothetical protein
VVRVTGKLRLRADQFSLACDRVQEYSAKEPASTNGSGPPSQNGGKPARSNGARQARVPKPRTAESAAANGGRFRTVFVGVTESEDPTGDAHLLREVVRVLLEYPGKDRVNLNINTGGRRVLMELPVVNTSYCDSLRERLEALLGPEAVAFQDSTGPVE